MNADKLNEDHAAAARRIYYKIPSLGICILLQRANLDEGSRGSQTATKLSLEQLMANPLQQLQNAEASRMRRSGNL